MSRQSEFNLNSTTIKRHMNVCLWRLAQTRECAIPQAWTSFWSSGSSRYKRSSSFLMFLSANLKMSGDSWSTTLSELFPVTNFRQLVPAPKPLVNNMCKSTTCFVSVYGTLALSNAHRACTLKELPIPQFKHLQIQLLPHFSSYDIDFNFYRRLCFCRTNLLFKLGLPQIFLTWTVSKQSLLSFGP
jgi:hypothetical protein